MRLPQLLPQRFHLLPSLPARANVALPLVELGRPKRDRRERATELLSEVGLDTRTTHRPGQLSGGEQQRVAIARALATEPSLVVASHDQQAIDACDRVIYLHDGRIQEKTRQ